MIDKLVKYLKQLAIPKYLAIIELITISRYAMKQKRMPAPSQHAKKDSSSGSLQSTATLFTPEQERAENKANQLIERACDDIAKLNQLYANAETNDFEAANEEAELQADLRNLKEQIKQCDKKLGRIIPEEDPSFLLVRRH